MSMQKIRIDDFTRFKFLGALSYSPDGRHAAFTVTTSDKENNKYRKDIWLLDNRSKAVRRLTSTGKAGKPIWWDDNTVVFQEIRDDEDKKKTDGGETLSVFQSIAIDGGEAVELMRFDKSVSDIKRLDDNTLAVTYTFDPKAPRLDGLSEKEKAEALRKAKEEKDYEVLTEIPYWFNGQGFINGQRTWLGIYDLRTKSLTPVTEPDEDIQEMRLDKDGILFTSQKWSGMRPEINALKRYNWKDAAMETLVPQGNHVIYWFDRFNAKVIFLGLQVDELRYGYNENIKFFQVDGSGISKILSDDDNTPTSNVIGDSTLGGGDSIMVRNGRLYYSLLHGSRATLRCVNTDGSSKELFEDRRSVEFFDVHGDDLLFCSMFPDRLEELYHMDLRTGETTQVTHFNDDYAASMNIIVPRRLDITHAGEKVEGFVIKPADFDEKKSYPCILDIHGGPKCAYGDVYFHEMQVWANAGYFVIFCNPHGSEGYGNEFAYLCGKYGTIDYDQLMAFTDAALKAYPQIDAGRLGVTGGSYGGFMTNWIIGHTDRFKAAASQRSIANWVSFENTTDIGYTFAQDQQKATTWTDVKSLWSQSPLKYADRVSTPTLFIHSDNDYRCWMAEGLQMFTALKSHGVEARLCLFHGETHELSRGGKPLHRIRRLEEITSWFDSHLK